MATRRTAGKDNVAASETTPRKQRKSGSETRSSRSTSARAAARTGRTETSVIEEQPTNGAADHSQPSPAEIQRLAYSFWEARGRQGGSPEADWFRAEQELRNRAAAAAGA